MKYGTFLIALTLMTVYSCTTMNKAQSYINYNYNDLYQTWMVDTIIVLNTDKVTTPNIEMDQNEYQFTKEGTSLKQGIRTTRTSGASIAVPFTIKKGSIHFDPAATFPLLNINEEGELASSNLYGVSLAPYEIIELTSTRLGLKNQDIIMKLKVK